MPKRKKDIVFPASPKFLQFLEISCLLKLCMSFLFVKSRKNDNFFINLCSVSTQMQTAMRAINQHCISPIVSSRASMNYWSCLVPAIQIMSVENAAFSLPFTHLRSLIIMGCEKIPMHTLISFNFWNLKNLTIWPPMEDSSLQIIAATCPQLCALTVFVERTSNAIVIANFPKLLHLYFTCSQRAPNIKVYVAHMPVLETLRIISLHFHSLEIGLNVSSLHTLKLSESSLHKLVFREIVTLTHLDLPPDSQLTKLDPFTKVNWRLEFLRLSLTEYTTFPFTNVQNLKVLKLHVQDLDLHRNIELPWNMLHALEELAIAELTHVLLNTILSSNVIFTNLKNLHFEWREPTIVNCNIFSQFPNVENLQIFGAMCNFDALLNLKHVTNSNLKYLKEKEKRKKLHDKN